MKAIKKKADEMQKGGNVVGAIKYREDMAKRWSKIVKWQINVGKCSIEDIEQDRFDGEAGTTIQTVTSNTLEVFQANMSPQGSPLSRGKSSPNNITPFSQQQTSANNIIPFSQSAGTQQKAA